MNERVYYVRISGRITGPLPMSQLRRMRDARQLSRVHELSEDQRLWVPVSRFTELSGGGSELELTLERNSDHPAFDIADAWDGVVALPQWNTTGTGSSWTAASLFRLTLALSGIVLLTATLLPDAQLADGLTWWWHWRGTGVFGRISAGFGMAMTALLVPAIAIFNGFRRELLVLAGLSVSMVLLGGATKSPEAAPWTVGGVVVLAAVSSLAVCASFHAQHPGERTLHRWQWWNCVALLIGVGFWGISAALVGAGGGAWTAANWAVGVVAAVIGVMGMAEVGRGEEWRWTYWGSWSLLAACLVLAGWSLTSAVDASAESARLSVLWMVRYFVVMITLIALSLLWGSIHVRAELTLVVAEESEQTPDEFDKN